MRSTHFCHNLTARKRKLWRQNNELNNRRNVRILIWIRSALAPRKLVISGYTLEWDPSDQRRGRETPWDRSLVLSWVHSRDWRLKVTGGGVGMHPHRDINSWPMMTGSLVCNLYVVLCNPRCDYVWWTHLKLPLQSRSLEELQDHATFSTSSPHCFFFRK